MKKLALILAIYLLLGSIMPRTDFSQYGRLVELWTHYQHHLEEAGSQKRKVSFLNYLYVHYISPDEHGHDDHQDHHEKLPFQSINSAITVFFTHSNPIEAFSIRVIPNKNGVHQNPFHLTGFPTSVFHPPARI